MKKNRDNAAYAIRRVHSHHVPNYCVTMALSDLQYYSTM